MDYLKYTKQMIAVKVVLNCTVAIIPRKHVSPRGSIFSYFKMIAGQWTGLLWISLKSSHIEKKQIIHMVDI